MGFIKSFFVYKVWWGHSPRAREVYIIGKIYESLKDLSIKNIYKGHTPLP